MPKSQPALAGGLAALLGVALAAPPASGHGAPTPPRLQEEVLIGSGGVTPVLAEVVV